jgi:Fe2+ or Zn2+ uptake regulation protein
MSINTDVRRELAAAGCRVTEQRLAVLEALWRAGDHPSAERVYHVVRRSHPTMSRATVYRALELFASLDVAGTFRAADGVARYDPDRTPHVNFECAVCGRVADVMDSRLQALTRRTADRAGFVLGRQIALRGTCRRCAVARQNYGRRKHDG